MMNGTTLEGQAQSVAGSVKQAVGTATGDTTLKARGTSDQLLGDAKQVLGAATDAIGNPGPLIDKARTFARERPWATAALVGTIGLAVFNTLRGK